jgi:transglutaminase-like putative cysteine protease
MPKGGKFPYKGNDKQLNEATKPSRYLQSDDPKIKELARQAIGDIKDADEAAKRIERFVADYITDASLSIGYASAAEVAQSRKGDCSEFSVLCAALCRAAGIPARITVGVAYTDNFMGRSGFGGHAWVEVNIDGKWVGLDPTFTKGGKSFDAGHITLASGDGEPAAFFNIATAMGRFKIEKVMVERK